MADLERVESVKILRLEPCDKVVVRAKGKLADYEERILRLQVRFVFPDNEILILDNDTQLDVVRPSLSRGD